jgi:hypothetical protein
VEKAGMRGNVVGDGIQFGIIRKAALYAGHEPRTVKLFRDMWRKGRTTGGFSPGY